MHVAMSASLLCLDGLPLVPKVPGNQVVQQHHPPRTLSCAIRVQSASMRPQLYTRISVHPTQSLKRDFLKKFSLYFISFSVRSFLLRHQLSTAEHAPRHRHLPSNGQSIPRKPQWPPTQAAPRPPPASKLCKRSARRSKNNSISANSKSSQPLPKPFQTAFNLAQAPIKTFCTLTPLDWSPTLILKPAEN